MSSQNGGSNTQKILITENSEPKPPNTEKKIMRKLNNRYEKIIQSNNFLRANSDLEKIYSASKKKGHYSRKVMPSCDLNHSSENQVMIQSRDNIVNFMD